MLQVAERKKKRIERVCRGPSGRKNRGQTKADKDEPEERQDKAKKQRTRRPPGCEAVPCSGTKNPRDPQQDSSAQRLERPIGPERVTESSKAPDPEWRRGGRESAESMRGVQEEETRINTRKNREECRAHARFAIIKRAMRGN